MSDDPVTANHHAATLTEWRTCGLDRVDPVRFAFIDGLVRRAALRGGSARRLLDKKIASLMESYGDAVAHAFPAASAPAPLAANTRAPEQATSCSSARTPLGALAQQIHQQRLARVQTPALSTMPSAAGLAPPRELEALDDVRNIWARLEAQKRLKQATAQAPQNAGPLNSYHLVLRALTLMRDVSPEYLQRFMAHVDTLIWLERTAS